LRPDDAAARARATLDRLLETDAPALRAGLPPTFADAAEAYVRQLLEANARQNLTRVVDPEGVASQHLLDSLAALPWVDAAAPRTAIDLGSGGGVPGIVLALARPSIAWTLVDSARRKADALRGFVEALGVRNVTVVAERAETMGRGDHRGAVDLVTARACAALPVLAEYALPLLRPGGTLLAWKGPNTDVELGSGATASRLLGGGVPEVHLTGVPALGDHRFVVIRKEGVTPDRYPRRPGEPARRPLG
jgi:16S rRNA (guanine527-N7)-methyltransferase